MPWPHHVISKLAAIRPGPIPSGPFSPPDPIPSPTNPVPQPIPPLPFSILFPLKPFPFPVPPYIRRQAPGHLTSQPARRLRRCTVWVYLQAALNHTVIAGVERCPTTAHAELECFLRGVLALQ